MTTWRMRVACWITKATHTHTHMEYVILFSFATQQWLHDHASMLHYTYFACLFKNFLRHLIKKTFSTLINVSTLLKAFSIYVEYILPLISISLYSVFPYFCFVELWSSPFLHCAGIYLNYKTGFRSRSVDGNNTSLQCSITKKLINLQTPN